MKSNYKTMKTFVFSIFMMTGIFLLTSASVSAQKKENAKLAKDAKITMQQARTTALKRVSGTIEEGELEKEKGKLIWSFDITTPGSKEITEVAVDAITGDVVAVDKETPAQEAKEQKAKGKKKEKEEDEKK